MNTYEGIMGFGINGFPTRPVKLDFDHQLAVIEMCDRRAWESNGWKLAGF
jgi:hypothetical protein